MESTNSSYLANTPAGRPPPGVIPNFSNPPTDAPAYIIIGSILVGIMIVFVCTRIYTKVKIVGKSSPDDYTCILGTAGTICYYVNGMFAVTAGHFGTHMWDLTLSDLSSDAFAFTGFFANWTTNLIWPFIKVTFFLMYIQIFRPMKWLRYSSYAGATVNVLFYLSTLVASLAFLVPAAGQSLQQALLGPREARAIAMSVPIASMNLVLDVFILVLPLLGISKLQLPPKRKIGVAAVFFTGFLACIASSLSIYYRWVLTHYPTDVTKQSMPVILLSLVEMCVGIIASCMPSMSALFRHLPSWDTLSSKLSVRLPPSWRSFNRDASSALESSPTSSKKDEYKNLESSDHSFGDRVFKVAPARSVQTFVHTGRQAAVEEDGIHLQHFVEQRSTFY